MILIVDCFDNKSRWVKNLHTTKAEPMDMGWSASNDILYLITYDNHVSALLSISNSEFLICNSAHDQHKKIKFSGSFLTLV